MNPLQAHGLHRFHRRGGSEVAALLDVSLTCAAGELVAVTGPSGAGKSTLLSLLAGLDEPDGGWVKVAGHRIDHVGSVGAARLRARHIGVLPQSGGLFGHLTVWENIRFAASLRQGRGPRLGDLIDGLGLVKVRNSLPRKLSGGETARAGLALALAGAPDVLLADEPTAEVSAQEESVVLDLLQKWRPENGATVVVTHAPAVAERADRVLSLVDGRLA